MYIHSEIQKAVLPLLAKYDIDLITLMGEMAHAAWEMSELSERGIQKLMVELNEEDE